MKECIFDSNDGIILSALNFVKKLLPDEVTGHDYLHAERVMQNAKAIILAAKNNPSFADADETLILLSCILHDVDDYKLSVSKNDNPFYNLHGFCNENAITSEQEKALIDVISKISFSKNSSKNTELSIEAQIAQDADRLDALGAIGIARTFAYGGFKGRPILSFTDKNNSVQHFYDKLLLLPALMNTEYGKAEGEKRKEFMIEFLRRLKDECQAANNADD